MNISLKSLIMPPYQISNYVTSPRKMCFEDWLNSPVTKGDCHTDSLLINQGYTHQRFIQEFIYDLNKVITSNGYNITDVKQFKNEIATHIYRLSREPKNGRY
jgi:hypothetical protein